MNINDYIIDQEGIDWSNVLSEWTWLGLRRFVEVTSAKFDLAVVQPLHHLVVADQPFLADTLAICLQPLYNKGRSDGMSVRFYA